MGTRLFLAPLRAGRCPAPHPLGPPPPARSAHPSWGSVPGEGDMVFWRERGGKAAPLPPENSSPLSALDCWGGNTDRVAERGRSSRMILPGGGEVVPCPADLGEVKRGRRMQPPLRLRASLRSIRSSSRAWSKGSGCCAWLRPEPALGRVHGAERELACVLPRLNSLSNRMFPSHSPSHAKTRSTTICRRWSRAPKKAAAPIGGSKNDSPTTTEYSNIPMCAGPEGISVPTTMAISTTIEGLKGKL